ncbi:MAG: hypothetical protein KJ976_06840 [Proteobacteria bacterium]|nr:hypothetical protein [Pseudomonadota bacterium]
MTRSEAEVLTISANRQRYPVITLRKHIGIFFGTGIRHSGQGQSESRFWAGEKTPKNQEDFLLL